MEKQNIDSNNIQMNNFTETGGKFGSKKEKIIVTVLAIIFFAVLIGAFWDLYGRKLLTNSLCSPQNVVVNNNLQATTTDQQLNVNKNEQPAPKNEQNNQQLATSTNSNTEKNPAPKTENNVAYASYSTCLENAKDLAASKDCCDCLSGDASLHKACRDAAATYDFSKNTIIKQFTIPSKLGRNGDYSAFTASGNQQQCKQACESATSGLACGDYQYCRTACNSLPQ